MLAVGSLALAQTPVDAAPSAAAYHAAAATPEASRALARQAEQAHGAKRYDEAVRLLMEMDALEPGNSSVPRLLGSSLSALALYAEAEGVYSRAIQADPKDASAWTSRCWARIMGQSRIQARGDCEKSLELDPSRWDARVSLGHTYLLQGDVDAAQDLYRDALWRIETDKQLNEGPLADFLMFIQRGWQVRQAQRSRHWFQEQWPRWQQVRKYTAEHVRLSNAGRPREALAPTREAAQLAESILGPEHAQTGLRLNNLAVLYHDMGRYDQALPLYQRALAISEKTQGPEHPTTGRLLRNLASLYRYMGRYEQALPLGQRALAISEKAQGQFKASLGQPVLHIASHFRFLPGSDESFLLLGDGSGLTLRQLRTEMPRLTGVDLLTLSACETAVGGGLKADGREVEGLGVLAQRRGARSVLASLWPVEDASTGDLMAKFYQHRQAQGLNKAQALRQAQLALLHGGTAPTVVSPPELRGASAVRTAEPPPPVADTPDPRRPFAHPFFWAPFILMGNWL
jgi:tetratricopeptide (TPR) repeat protein